MMEKNSIPPIEDVWRCEACKHYEETKGKCEYCKYESIEQKKRPIFKN